MLAAFLMLTNYSYLHNVQNIKKKLQILFSFVVNKSLRIRKNWFLKLLLSRSEKGSGVYKKPKVYVLINYRLLKWLKLKQRVAMRSNKILIQNFH